MSAESFMTGEQILFATVCLALLASVANGAAALRGRRYGLASLNAVNTALLAGLAALLWFWFGGCLLPHPRIIPYRQGMALCPGQGSDLSIELRAAASGKSL
jgi:hypothetical protein